MRTTIDMPDGLMRRVKILASRRNTTFRALVVDALERTLDEPIGKFKLEDASVGKRTKNQSLVSSETINEAIREQRKYSFSP